MRGCHEVVEILLRMLWTRRLGSPDNIAPPSLANVPFIEFHPRVMTIETCILSKQNTEHLPLSPSLSRPEPTQSFVQLQHTFKKQEWRDRGEHCIRVEYTTANLHLQHVNFFKDWYGVFSLFSTQCFGRMFSGSAEKCLIPSILNPRCPGAGDMLHRPPCCR